MRILRLLALLVVAVSVNLPAVAQTAQQRQLQQQRSQQQQLQQQRYQRQQQLQARQQRLQQLQARQRQLQQQQQQLRYRQQQLQQQRQTAGLKVNATANANKKLAAARANAVRRKTILSNSQQAQSNKMGRNRALAVAKSASPVSSVSPKTPIPLAKSSQVLQAKTALRTNQLNTLRASLQTKLQARATRSSSVIGVRGEEQRPKAGGGGGCEEKPENCDPPRRASSVEGPKRPPDTKIPKKKEEEKTKADEKLSAVASHGGSSTSADTPVGAGGRNGGPSNSGSGSSGGDGGSHRPANDNYLWSSTKSLSDADNAAKHWKDHGHEFPEYRTQQEYISAAQHFVRQPSSNVQKKVRANGDVLLYDRSTNTFAVRTASGTARTMFKPTDGEAYFERQK